MQSLTMENMRREMVLHAIQRKITCGIKGIVLDIDDAYLISNRASGQMAIVSGDAWRGMRANLPDDFAVSLEVWEGKTGEELS